VIDHLLTQTLSLYRPTDSVDSGGGREDTLAQIGTLRAKVNQPTPAEVELAGVWGAQLSHVVHAGEYNDIRRGDEFGGDLPSEVQPNERLRVIAVVSDSHSTYKRMLCITVQGFNDALEGSSS
jgi:hypothetical protein